LILAVDALTPIVATPYLDEAERCHRVALMYEGVLQSNAGFPSFALCANHVPACNRPFNRNMRIADCCWPYRGQKPKKGGPWFGPL